MPFCIKKRIISLQYEERIPGREGESITEIDQKDLQGKNWVIYLDADFADFFDRMYLLTG